MRYAARTDLIVESKVDDYERETKGDDSDVDMGAEDADEYIPYSGEHELVGEDLWEYMRRLPESMPPLTPDDPRWTEEWASHRAAQRLQSLWKFRKYWRGVMGYQRFPGVRYTAPNNDMTWPYKL